MYSSCNCYRKLAATAPAPESISAKILATTLMLYQYTVAASLSLHLSAYSSIQGLRPIEFLESSKVQGLPFVTKYQSEDASLSIKLH